MAWTQTPLTLTDAILGFFDFYATLDLENKMVSISDGGIIDRRAAYQSRSTARGGGSLLNPDEDERHNHPLKWKSHL
jgi:hypothetical protein